MASITFQAVQDLHQTLFFETANRLRTEVLRLPPFQEHIPLTARRVFEVSNYADDFEEALHLIDICTICLDIPVDKRTPPEIILYAIKHLQTAQAHPVLSYIFAFAALDGVRRYTSDEKTRTIRQVREILKQEMKDKLLEDTNALIAEAVTCVQKKTDDALLQAEELMDRAKILAVDDDLTDIFPDWD